MTNPMRILVPLDGSAEAEAILPILTPLVKARSYEVDLLRVVEAPAPTAPAEAYLEARRARLLAAGVRAAAHAVAGRPVDEIVREAERARPALIAMTMLKRGPAGSVSTAVLRRAPAPVVVTRPGLRGGDWRKIVVALDGFAGAEEVLSGAGPLARAFKATLHVLYVGLPLLPYDDRKGSVPVMREQADAYLREVCERLGAQGIQALPEKREGAPGPAICRAAEQAGAGLLCIASAMCGAGPAFRSEGVTEFVLLNAPCPVWVCAKGAPSEPRGSTKRLLRV
jgi:nucleotide-binding universal stress UspA family protein